MTGMVVTAARSEVTAAAADVTSVDGISIDEKMKVGGKMNRRSFASPRCVWCFCVYASIGVFGQCVYVWSSFERRSCCESTSTVRRRGGEAMSLKEEAPR